MIQLDKLVTVYQSKLVITNHSLYYNHRMRYLLLLFIFLLAACAPATPFKTLPSAQLSHLPVPYPASHPRPMCWSSSRRPFPPPRHLYTSFNQATPSANLPSNSNFTGCAAGGESRRFPEQHVGRGDFLDSRCFIHRPKRSDAHARACSRDPNRLPPDSGRWLVVFRALPK